MTYTQIFTKNIREIIEQRKLRLSEVADRAGIPRHEFKKLLAGRQVIRAEYVPKIAAALKMSIDALYSEAAPSVVIGDCRYSEIAVVDRDDNLIASITADNIIEKKGYKVVCAHAEN